MGARPLIDYLKGKSESSNEETENNENNENSENENGENANRQEEQGDPVDAWKQEYARKLGWTSKDEWEQSGRDPEMWRDHNMFLDTSPGYFERLRKKNREYKTRMEREAAAAAATIDEERRRAREEAIREAREAATAGDADRAAAAAERAATAGPPPETQAWMAKNPWFNSDPDARALAASAVERAAAAGKSITEQLEIASNSVKKRFPEYFEEDDLDELPEFITRQTTRKPEETPQREVKMSQSAKVASAAAGTQSARVRTPNSNKEKGFNDLPSETKASYEKYFAKKFAGRYKSADEAREAYAKRYFSNLIDKG